MTAKCRKNFSIFILRLAMLVAFAGLYASCGYQEKELVLLHTNDSHGSIRAVDSLGGMAERATYIRSVRARYPRVLLLDAGDINTGQVVSNMFDARPDIEAYNEMGYDAVALGNHEFDKPLEVLFRQMQWADFPFLTSNVRWQGKTLGKEYLIKEIDGIKVGIFGLTTRETCEVSVYAGQVGFEDEVEVARNMVKVLKQQSVDVVIGLVHLGFTGLVPGFITSSVLASRVEGIDILVDGHSHSYIGQPKRINHTWIVTANQSGRYVGEGKLKFRRGHLVDFSWKPVEIKGFPPDSLLVRKLLPYCEAADRDLQTKVGEATGDFGLFTEGENRARYEEAALGNLVADALKWKAEALTGDVDFALTNSGGIRQNLTAGPITKGEILSVLPFGNTLEVVTMEGKDVRRLFDFLATVPAGNGAFAQVSREVKVVYDRAAGQVRNLTIGGRPIVDTMTYRMATCDFVASGKDGYKAAWPERLRRENTSCLLSEALIGYIRWKKSVEPLLDGRIRVVDVQNMHK